MWRETKKIFQEHGSFLISTHVNPDGDGIGSACALADLLSRMGKQVCFVYDGLFPEKFSFLSFPGIKEIFYSEENYSDVEVVVMVDAHSADRLGRVAQIFQRPDVVKVVIDHHQPQEIPAGHCVIDSNASSTGSMIYTLYKESGYELTKEAAEGLYVSVISDTGRFCYSSTDRKAHKIAEECMKKGVDPDWMYAHLYQQVSLPEFKVFAKALQHMEEHFNNRVIVQKILREDFVGVSDAVQEILQSDLEYFHEFNKIIVGVDCVMLLCERPNRTVRVSLRSSGSFRVDRIASQFGGGGHPKAAGASLKGTVEGVKEKVLEKIQQELERLD